MKQSGSKTYHLKAGKHAPRTINPDQSLARSNGRFWTNYRQLVAFTAALMESSVRFVAIDMPDVNDMVIHILASVAQGEAKAISDRTKAALRAAKARGTRLGGLRWNLASVGDKGRQAGLEVRQAKAASYSADILPIIEEKRRAGIVTLKGIAAAMNTDGTPAPRGGKWSAVQVQRILHRNTSMRQGRI